MHRYASIFRLVSVFCLGLLSSSVFGLGLGEITLKSHLNQPLIAEIELLQVRELTLSEILPGLASRKDFEAAGVERSFLLGMLNFEIKLGVKGRNIILVTTDKPVREPFLNFLVEVIWPSGRLLREYTLLLDPPLFSNNEIQVSSPAETSSAKKSKTAVIARTPTDSPKPVQNSAPKEINKTAAETFNKSNSGSPTAIAPNTKSKTTASSSSSGAVDRPPVNLNTPTDGDDMNQEQYRVKRGDNLLQIANDLSNGRSSNIYQVMVAIQRENPQAFINGNIHLIKQGSVIRKPSADQIASIDRSTAFEEIERQTKIWKSRSTAQQQNANALDARVLNATGEDTTPDAPTNKNEDGGHLTLVSSGTTSNSQSGSGGSATSGNDRALLAEELDKMKVTNLDLGERVSSLTEQLDGSKKLIELKNQQFTELQARLAEIDAENARLKAQMGMPAATSAPEATAPPVDSTPPAADEQAPVEQQQAPVTQEQAPVIQEQALDTQISPPDESMAAPISSENAETPIVETETPAASTAPVDFNFSETTDESVAQPVAESTEEPALETPALSLSGTGNALMQDVLNKPIYWIIIGGGIILLASAIILWRRNQQKQFDEDDGAFEEDIDQENTNTLVDIDPMSLGEMAVGNEETIGSKNAVDITVTDSFAAGSSETLSSRSTIAAKQGEDSQSLISATYQTNNPTEEYLNTETEEEATDILGEADIYIAYGRFDQAEEVLVKAIKRDKSHPEFYLKLIEVYAEKNDTVGFNRTEELLASQGFSASFLHRINELRATLSNATIEEILDTEPELNAAEKVPSKSVEDLDLDLDYDNQSVQTENYDDTLEAMSALDELESNIIGDIPESNHFKKDLNSLDGSVNDTKQKKKHSEPSDDFAFSNTLSTLDAESTELLFEGNENDNIITPKFEHEGLQDNTLFSNINDLYDSSLDIDIESLAANLDADIEKNKAHRMTVSRTYINEAEADEVINDEDEVATKLDLARAYIDMGDREGAKDILDEVVRDGSKQQKEEAKSLLKKMS